MEQVTIIIHWKGPFLLEDVQASEFGNGLYLFTGKRKHERIEQIQYFGITEGLYRNRFNNYHHKIFEVTRDLSIWLGEIAYPSGFNRQHLETAEAILIYFWQPNLNDRKKVTPPKATTLISHWFKPDGTPRIYQKQLYKDLADVLCWDGEFWRTGNLSVWQDGY